MKKRVVCAFLGLVMMVSQSFTVFADTESDIRQQKAQAESQLSQTNDTIASLSEQQQQIQSEINAMDADMVDLMIQIDATKTDIASVLLFHFLNYQYTSYWQMDAHEPFEMSPPA